MDKRKIKDLLYEEVARIGKAVSSPKRLELLEILAQGEKTVDALAVEASIDIKLASAHLKVLKAVRLVVAGVAMPVGATVAQQLRTASMERAGWLALRFGVSLCEAWHGHVTTYGCTRFSAWAGAKTGASIPKRPSRFRGAGCPD